MQSLEQAVVAGARKRLIRGIVFLTALMGTIFARNFYSGSETVSTPIIVLVSTTIGYLTMYFAFKKELRKALKEQAQ